MSPHPVFLFPGARLDILPLVYATSFHVPMSRNLPFHVQRLTNRKYLLHSCHGVCPPASLPCCVKMEALPARKARSPPPNLSDWFLPHFMRWPGTKAPGSLHVPSDLILELQHHHPAIGSAPYSTPMKTQAPAAGLRAALRSCHPQALLRKLGPHQTPHTQAAPQKEPHS